MSLVAVLRVVALVAAGEVVLDLPPGESQVGYSPADGATVAVNPPPFVWVPPADNLLYMVEIAPAEDFTEDGRMRLHDVDISTVALREALPPGRWFWRYAVQAIAGAPDFDGATWSKARAFAVPEDAMLMPYPGIERVVAAIPQTRPRMFFLAEEIEDYRRRAREGDLKDATASLVRGVEKSIGEEIVAEPPFVTGEGAERGRNYADIIRSTRPPMDAMERAALAYLLTGEERFGQEAKRRILYFFRWDPEGSTAYNKNDEPAMWVMMRGVRAYDWAYDLFTPEERAEVEACMHIRAEQFYNHLRNRQRFHTRPFASHSGRTIGFLGEACIAFAHEWPEAPEWLDYVLTNYWNVYPAWGKADGGWHEGPGYYTAYMSFVLHFITPLKKAAGVDLTEKPFFQNTPYYLLYTNPPYAKISPFGDGESDGSSGGRGQVMYAFSSLTGNPYARWYARQQGVEGEGLLGIALKDDMIEPKSPAELPSGRFFPGVGLVSLHTALGDGANDIHFLIHSDPYGAISHAHADQNAFTLEAFGEPLAIASGYYPWYGSDHHTKWQWESKSSNTITMDGGVGQKIRSPESRGAIVAFDNGEAYDYVAADATQAYPDSLSRFIRHVVHVRPGVFVMYDDVQAMNPASLEWRLHARSEMALDQNAQSVLVSQGDARMVVRFFAPDAVKLEQTTGFEFPPERGGDDQWHLVASTPEKVSEAAFLTVLVPYRAGEEGALPQVSPLSEAGRCGVVIAGPDGTDTVTFATGTEGAEDNVQRHVDVQAQHTAPDGAVSRVMRHRVTEMARVQEGKAHRVVFHTER